MKSFDIVLERDSACRITGWIHSTNGSSEMPQRLYPAVVICPGGGYEFVSDREAEPVAAPFYAAGYNTFILRYSTGADAGGLRPLCQLAALVEELRSRHEAYCTNPDQIAVCGFSAGAHLAASLGVLSKEPAFLQAYGSDFPVRPDAMVLCYPVITADEHAHVGSIRNVSGAEPGTQAYRWFGLDAHVDGSTPPAFLWHTADDQSVPVENSLKMAAALSRAKVPFELHVFPEGIHGMSVCTQEVNTPGAYNARWVQWCVAWLNRQFHIDRYSSRSI